MLYDINIQPTQFAVFETENKMYAHAKTLFDYHEKGGFTSGDGLPKAVDDAIRALNLLHESRLVFQGTHGLTTARLMPVTLVKNKDRYFILAYRNYNGAFPHFKNAAKLEPDDLADFRATILPSQDTLMMSMQSAKECPVPDDFDKLQHEVSQIRAIGQKPTFH